MAKIEIESAFIEAWTKATDQHPSWGMRTAEPHSRKNDAGKYETVGRTFRTVKVSRASGIDLTQFRKGDRVTVWGKEVTESREYEISGEIRKAYELVVWADRVELAESRAAASPQAPVAADSWATSSSTDEETPF